MLPNILNKSNTSTGHIQSLPLEIIAKIVRQLSLSDIIALTSVSKVWRSRFLNQNVIWKDICQRLSVRDEDYTKCLIDTSKKNTSMLLDDKEYFELYSVKLFGPYCHWWKIYNRYNMILKSIKDNNYPNVHVPCRNVHQSYCTDDYIINLYINKKNHQTIQAIILGNCSQPIDTVYLPPLGNFYQLFEKQCYTTKIVGNKHFLVLEIHSIIYVYKIENYKFVPKYTKIIKTSDHDITFADESFVDFLVDHFNTKIDLCGSKLALIHPKSNVLFFIDLESGEVCRELKYSDKKCQVDCIKCAEERLMIGISCKETDDDISTDHYAVVYHLEESTDNKFKVPLFGAVTQFKVTNSYIGIENKASATPFLTKSTKLIHIFWLDCDTFSFDCTRKFIYYNVNQSIFQYDLKKSRMERFEVVQKIAINAISSHFSLTPINDRFLLVQSTIPNAYDIFDVIEHTTVKSIQLKPGFHLVHVGKMSLVFSNSTEYQIAAFC